MCIFICLIIDGSSTVQAEGSVPEVVLEPPKIVTRCKNITLFCFQTLNPLPEQVIFENKKHELNLETIEMVNEYLIKGCSGLYFIWILINDYVDMLSNNCNLMSVLYCTSNFNLHYVYLICLFDVYSSQ